MRRLSAALLCLQHLKLLVTPLRRNVRCEGRPTIQQEKPHLRKVQIDCATSDTSRPMLFLLGLHDMCPVFHLQAGCMCRLVPRTSHRQQLYCRRELTIARLLSKGHKSGNCIGHLAPSGLGCLSSKPQHRATQHSGRAVVKQISHSFAQLVASTRPGWPAGGIGCGMAEPRSETEVIKQYKQMRQELRVLSERISELESKVRVVEKHPNPLAQRNRMQCAGNA